MVVNEIAGNVVFGLFNWIQILLAGLHKCTYSWFCEYGYFKICDEQRYQLYFEASNFTVRKC